MRPSNTTPTSSPFDVDVCTSIRVLFLRRDQHRSPVRLLADCFFTICILLSTNKVMQFTHATIRFTSVGPVKLPTTLFTTAVGLWAVTT